LVEIEPFTHRDHRTHHTIREFRVVTRLTLPDTCFTPHGMAIDTEAHIAFIACIDANPPSLLRVDLTTMQVIQEPPWPVAEKPDILVIDHPLHLLYVACGAGIAIFQYNGQSLLWLATYTFGFDTHTIAVNEVTHQIYLPLVRVGNRPVLRIMQYNANDPS